MQYQKQLFQQASGAARPPRCRAWLLAALIAGSAMLPVGCRGEADQRVPSTADRSSVDGSSADQSSVDPSSAAQANSESIRVVTLHVKEMSDRLSLF